MVRLDLDAEGKGDERIALSILQEGVGLNTADASRAWDRLGQTNVEWMQAKSGGSRDGMSVHLNVIGIHIDGNGKAAVRAGVSLVAPATGVSDGLAQQLLREAENRFPHTWQIPS